MLVLTRKPNEQIHIGDNVTITVLRIQGNTVRLGLSAPRDVRVVRGELKRFVEPAAPVEDVAEVHVDQPLVHAIELTLTPTTAGSCH